MHRIGALELDGSPRVAVGFSDKFTVADILDAKGAGLDIAEIRVDQFRSFDPSYVNDKLAMFADKIPTLATIRIADEGGSWKGSESDRQKLFRSIIPNVDAIDIELQCIDTLKKIGPAVKAAGKLLVVSFHDFDTTPDLHKLEQIVRDAKERGADIVKIATNATEQEHLKSLASLLTGTKDIGLIVIGMGGFGFISRLLFPALGSLMTFASVPDQNTAPGQMPYLEMFDLLRLIYPTYNQRKLTELKILECV
jgi:3-dehydroquinate dehydratase-1